MSVRQIEALYLCVPRDEHGRPTYRGKLGRMMSDREQHEYGCFLLGIREPETVEALWAEKQAKAGAETAKLPRHPRRRK
jgi:hypothetical protein